MSDLATRLLLQLKDYPSCNDDLAVMIRKTVLEPFQLDLSRPDAIKKPPPTPTRFKQMATQLAPIAMRIVNQNIVGLMNLKRAASNTANYTVAVNCLVDTSFYALSALRHMNTYTALKPLDIEKTTSNLICKMVELGEYNRALDEIRKFRTLLASVAKVQLDSTKSPVTNKKQLNNPPTSGTATTLNKGILTEAQHNYQSITSRQSLSPAPPEFSNTTQWEQDMLNKYQDLFHFPLDTTINDRTMILLVLAYQMNTLRCWCEIGEGALAKYVPYFMEKSGNFIDWCNHLLTIDSATAKKQLDSFQRLLYKAANRYPLTEDAAYHCYNIQTVALHTIIISGTNPLKAAMDRMVRISITYEKATSQTLYPQVQKRCHEMIEGLNLNVNDYAEMDSYFVLCEYYAYISRRAKSYQGAFYAYKFMIRPLVNIIHIPSTCSFYHAAYAANAKLALGSVQMEKIVTDDTFADIDKTLNECNSCLRIVSTSLANLNTPNEHTELALSNLCKSLDGFRISSKRLYEFVSEKTKNSLMEIKNNPLKTPPRMGELTTPSDFGQWNSNLTQLNATLQQCSETSAASLTLVVKKKVTTTSKRSTSASDILFAYIDIMVLLARMTFNINDESTYQQAYEHLSTAEQMCADVKISSGYRSLSASYYHIGATMIKAETFAGAIYPLRKSCTLLEKDTERISTDEGKLQICKRYEILGTCCQKNERFEEAIKAYRLALKRVPVSAIQKFVAQADTTAVQAMIEKDPLVPKLIDRFLRASIIDPHQSEIHFASEYMELSSLTAIQQCFIYECELKVWNVLALKMNLVKYQLHIIDKLLEAYNAEEYPIRRTRVLLNKVRIERSKQQDREKHTLMAMNCAKDAVQLLKAKDYAQDSNLLNYRRHYLALAYSWLAICGRDLHEEVPSTFSTTLQQWGILLKKITPIYNSGGSSKADIQQVYDSIDDVDQFYDHMRMLADLFGVTGQHIYQICALRILLKLNNGLRDINVDHVSDSIILTSTIGRIYCDMGYTGKASNEFNQAKHAISTRPCNNMSEIVYRVNYSYYLACIGDYETSREIFDATKHTWRHTPPVDSKNVLLTAKAYISRCMLLADIYSTKSLILANTDTFDGAIQCSTSVLQLLNKCIKVVQQQSKNVEKKKSSFELENPFMPAPKTSRQEQAEKVAFRESQWTMAKKLGDCLVTLAGLHMKKGSWIEAQYFVNQGPLLAEKVNSNVLYHNAYLCKSDFNLRCGNLTQSQEDLESTLVYQPEGSNHILDAVKLKMAMANLALANEYYDESITTYDEANDMLQKLSTSTYISSLEQLVDIRDDVSRDVKFEDEVVGGSSDKFECILLQQMQSINIIQKAFALSNKGEIEIGIALLEKLEEAGMVLCNQIELNAAIASLKMATVRQDISAISDANVLLKESLALPTMKVTAPRGAALIKKATVPQEVLVIRDNLTTILESMLETHRAGCTRERPSMIQGLCYDSGFAMFLRNHFANTSRGLPNNYALLSSYYLEMAKGISMRREMQNCLRLKMNRSLQGQVPSDTQWPLSEEEQEEQADRFQKLNLNPKWLQAHLNTLSDLYSEEHELNDHEFQEKFVDLLPVSWTVCSLTLDPVNQDLYAVQLRTSESPFVVKIPLNRSAQRSKKQQTCMQYKEAVEELQDIILGSDETIHNGKGCKEPHEVEAWWNTRTELDGRLKKLLDSIDNQWFSGFKGILSGRKNEYKEELNKFQKGLSEAVFKLVNENIPTNKKQVELSIPFCRMALRLGRYPTLRDLEDLAYFALSCYDAQPEIHIDYNKFDMKKMTDQIKLLITRYHDRSSAAGVDTTKNIVNDHVILILDKHLQMFPLESTPTLRYQSVSRLPCLSFLRDRILYAQSHASRVAFDDFGLNALEEWKDVSVSRKSAFYVVNPTGDLKDTQKEFESLFKSVPEWDGVVGSMPIELQCKDAFQSKDIYMYLGHSAGQTFMRGTTVRQLPKCAVSLLMGCSSGALESKGEFEPYGYVLNYLLAGSPAVVSNLWDVTDRSIDKLTKHILQSWGMVKSNNSNGRSKSLVQAVTESRAQCKLSYLIGAATVVYGIPVYISSSSSS